MLRLGEGMLSGRLMPIFQSPLRDDGYDISDYYTIQPVFGSVADFKKLLDEAHQRGMKVLTDLVMNHTSDQHPWFQSARSSRTSLGQNIARPRSPPTTARVMVLKTCARRGRSIRPRNSCVRSRVVRRPTPVRRSICGGSSTRTGGRSTRRRRDC